MKQQDVINLLVEKTISGDMVWYDRGDGNLYSASLNNRIYLFSNHFIQQVLQCDDKVIAIGILVVRELHRAILQQLQDVEDDAMSSLYHEILTS